MRKLLGVAVVVAVALLVGVSAYAAQAAPTTPAKPAVKAPAAAAAKSALVAVTGVVKVTKEADKVTKIEITHADTVYEVTMDAEGNKLAKEDGKSIAAKGTLAEKDGMKDLTVKSFKIVTPKAPAVSK